MSNDITRSILYAVETIDTSGGQSEYRLYLQHRVGRGLIDDPEITILKGPEPARTGFIMRFTGEDGIVEQVGEELKPLPMELYHQAYSDDGLTVVNLGFNGKVIDGQVLWVDDYMIVNANKQNRAPAP